MFGTGTVRYNLYRYPGHPLSKSADITHVVGLLKFGLIGFRSFSKSNVRSRSACLAVKIIGTYRIMLEFFDLLKLYR